MSSHCHHDTDGDGDCHLCVGGTCLMPRKITNTTDEVRRAGRGTGLAAACMFATPGSIEASERKGQEELTQSQQLPSKLGKDGRRVLEKLGVKFGRYSNGDPLFTDVALPAGWKIKATDHSMWSKLLDDKGREVGSIFYKAAFYDRDAFFDLSKEFQP